MVTLKSFMDTTTFCTTFPVWGRAAHRCGRAAILTRGSDRPWMRRGPPPKGGPRIRRDGGCLLVVCRTYVKLTASADVHVHTRRVTQAVPARCRSRARTGARTGRAFLPPLTGVTDRSMRGPLVAWAVNG